MFSNIRMFIFFFHLAWMLSFYVHCQTVNTDVGTFIGFVESVTFNGTQRQVVKYMGIPYGEPTDGENRFSEPKPKSPLSEPYIANRTDLPNVCPQLIGGYIIAATLNGRISEDCLYLHIYAPAGTLTTESKTYPVMIYIHGGSFVVGLSDQYPGDVLSSFNDVIVVTINYRLNVFGFFSSGDEKATGNYGLWDQHLAIKWVHNHITHFGGDPNEVTLFGGSAGSESVIFQAMFPENKGYFKRVIAESGSPKITAQSNMLPFAAFAGCNQTSSSEAISCLRAMTWEELSAKAEDPNEPVIFRPVIDGKFIKRDPDEAMADPNSEEMQFFSTIDIIVGVNSLEGAMYMLPLYGKIVGVEDKDISWIAINVTHEMTIERPLFEETIMPDVIMKRFFPVGAPSVVQDAIISKYSDWTEPDNPAKIRDMLMDLTTDLAFSVSAVKWANAHVQAVASAGDQRKTFFYQYTFFSNMFAARPQWMHKGADHADQILSVFGFLDRQALYSKYHVFSYTPNSDDLKMSSVVMKYWTNFAKTGNPNSPTEEQSWPDYTVESREHMKFTPLTTSFTSVEKHYGEPRVSFWLDIVPALIQGASTGVNNEITTIPNSKIYSDRFHINSVTAENIIIALVTVSSALILCLLIVACWGIAQHRRRSQTLVIKQPNNIV